MLDCQTVNNKYFPLPFSFRWTQFKEKLKTVLIQSTPFRPPEMQGETYLSLQ